MIIEKDHCIYFKTINDKYLFLTLYVNDILIASKDLGMIGATKE